MKEGEILEIVAKKKLSELTHEKVLEWAAIRLKYISNVIYTIQSETIDIPKNERTLFHLAEAQESLRHAIHVTGAKLEEKIIGIDKSEDIYRRLLDQKNRICDFVTVEIKEHDKMSGRTDKMSGFVKEFFSELDKFEEEIYNVI